MILEGQGQARSHLKSNVPWSHKWGPVQTHAYALKSTCVGTLFRPDYRRHFLLILPPRTQFVVQLCAGLASSGVAGTMPFPLKAPYGCTRRDRAANSQPRLRASSWSRTPSLLRAREWRETPNWGAHRTRTRGLARRSGRWRLSTLSAPFSGGTSSSSTER